MVMGTPCTCIISNCVCCRYIALDQEMEEISQIWKSAKDHLTNQHLEVIKIRGVEI